MNSSDVHSRDFLHKHAETPLCEEYVAAGALCGLRTNAESIREAARQTFLQIEGEAQAKPEFTLRLWSDDRDDAQAPWPKPYLRGLDHMVYMGLDLKSSVLIDLASRRAIGRVSAAMAADTRYWRTTIFPMLMSVMAGSVGLVELHASCVANGSDGLLLIGPGRSGKSTVAKAMSNLGFRVLSDDRVFCSLQVGGLRAYGLPRPIKLRTDAGEWFEELRGVEPRDVQNGEPVFYFDAGVRPSPCEPKAIVCLERAGDGCRVSRMERTEVRCRIEADLLAETPEVAERQDEVIDALLNLPCWHLQYGARPEVVAEFVAAMLRGESGMAAD